MGSVIAFWGAICLSTLSFPLGGKGWYFFLLLIPPLLDGQHKCLIQFSLAPQVWAGTKWPVKQLAPSGYCNYTRWKKSAPFIVLQWLNQEKPTQNNSYRVVLFKSNRIWSFSHQVMLSALLWLPSHRLKRLTVVLNVTLLTKSHLEWSSLAGYLWKGVMTGKS